MDDKQATARDALLGVIASKSAFCQQAPGFAGAEIAYLARAYNDVVTADPDSPSITGR